MYNIYAIITIIILIILGIYISSDRYFTQVKATVIRSMCKKVNNRYSCNLIIKYIINNIEYTNLLNDVYQRTPFNYNDTIPVFYNPVDPSIIQYGYNNFFASFICFIIAGILIYFINYF
jgi:hypothetical protein